MARQRPTYQPMTPHERRKQRAADMLLLTDGQRARVLAGDRLPVIRELIEVHGIGVRRADRATAKIQRDAAEPKPKRPKTCLTQDTRAYLRALTGLMAQHLTTPHTREES